MIPYDYIQTSGELESLVARLTRARCARLAVDVEGENNLHSYGIHVALIQLFDGSRGYAVDALAIRDAPPMKALLEQVPWVLVWFDAANDLLSFQHALGIRPSPILDVAIVGAIGVLAWGLLFAYFGATGRFRSTLGHTLDALDDARIRTAIDNCIAQQRNLFTPTWSALYIHETIRRNRTTNE